MISTGLAAGHPFEAWFVLDKSLDPEVPGYALSAGANILITFPRSFTPRSGEPVESVMIKWEQGGIPVKFTAAPESADPRTVAIHLEDAISTDGSTAPGLKAIHLRSNEINPAKPGDYPISIRFIDAGPLSGSTTAIAHITAKSVRNIAAYNQLHSGKDENWQHVKTGADAPLPLDFLVTLPDAPRATVSLSSRTNGGLDILEDGNLIGSITTTGVPVTLTPAAFGPGYSRLGIIEARAKAGMSPGDAQVVATLKEGTRFVIHLSVDAP